MLLLASVLLTRVCMGWLLLTLAITNSFSSQARFAGPAIGGSWLGSALLPATLAYSKTSLFPIVGIFFGRPSLTSLLSFFRRSHGKGCRLERLGQQRLERSGGSPEQWQQQQQPDKVNKVSVGL